MALSQSKWELPSKLRPKLKQLLANHLEASYDKFLEPHM